MPYEVVDGAIVVPAPTPEKLDALVQQVEMLYPARKPTDPGVGVNQLRGLNGDLDRIALHAALNALVEANRIRRVHKQGGAVPLIFFAPVE